MKIGFSRFYTTSNQRRNRGFVRVMRVEAILRYWDRKFLPTPHGLQTKGHACDQCFLSLFCSRYFLGLTAHVHRTFP